MVRDINLDVTPGEWTATGDRVYVGVRAPYAARAPLVCTCKNAPDAALIAQSKELFRIVEAVACRFHSVVAHETLERSAEKLIEKIRSRA